MESSGGHGEPWGARGALTKPRHHAHGQGRAEAPPSPCREQPQGWVLGAHPEPRCSRGGGGARRVLRLGTAVKWQCGAGGGLSAEILGALLSVLSIWVVTGVLVYLAAQRLLSANYDIEGSVMLVTSACAVAVNIVYVGLALTLSRCPPPLPDVPGDVTTALPAGWGLLCTRPGTGTATGRQASSPTPASALPSSTSWGTCCRVSASSSPPTSSSLRSGWSRGQRGCWGGGYRDSGFGQPWPGTRVRRGGPRPLPTGTDGDLGWG